MKPEPKYDINAEVVCWNHSAPEKPEKRIIAAREWAGEEPDNWEHLPTWEYLVSDSAIREPEINIRSRGGFVTAMYIVDEYESMYGALSIKACTYLIWEIAGAIDGQLRLSKDLVTEKYAIYF